MSLQRSAFEKTLPNPLFVFLIEQQKSTSALKKQNW